jgi:protein-tyrosine phosphatase
MFGRRENRKNVLFVCTGNYYRSRFAEILFNHLSKEASLPVHAFSRGFRLNPTKNIHNISPHTQVYLESLNIPFAYDARPNQLLASDFAEADKIVVLDENEHRPMMQTLFPEWEHKVEYWQFEDDYIFDPAEVLPKLEKKIKMLVDEFKK